jgi:hypothetical protein
LSSTRAGALPLNTPTRVPMHHFFPLNSTAIVEEAQHEVNRNLYPISKLSSVHLSQSCQNYMVWGYDTMDWALGRFDRY